MNTVTHTIARYCFTPIVMLAVCGASLPGHAWAQRSPEDVGGACPNCPVCPNPPTPPNLDLTCDNPTVQSNVKKDINGCLGCGVELVAQYKACYGDCPETPKHCCPISACPEGQSLMDPGSPNCYCMNNPDVCKKIGASSVRAVRRHSQVINTTVQRSFALNSGGWRDMPTDGGLLQSSSPCLYKIWHSCWEKYDSQGARTEDPWAFDSYADTNKAGWYIDSCILAGLTATNGMKLGYDAAESGGGITAWSAVKNLDANCQPLQPWQEELIQKAGCSLKEVQFTEWTSPVSLLWNSEVKIEEIDSRSRFPLNPTQAGRWFIWRASGQTPLIVWDPEGKGVVAAANQLFGTHTWDKQWKNGYEPLASLDANKNDWLEGEELKNIALWFDFNQDGVSDAGEVRSLASVGVEALGVKPSLNDEKNGRVFADMGFRRKTSSGVVVGRSVDWFSDVVEGDLGETALLPPVPDSGAEALKRFDLAGAKPKDSVAGVWVWRAVDPTGDELPENLPSGILSLYTEHDQLKGHTVINARLVPNQGGLREQVAISRLEGTVSRSQDGVIKLAFKSQTMHKGDVVTEAKLSEDGSRILGFTTEQVGTAKAPAKFLWVAQRAQPLAKDKH